MDMTKTLWLPSLRNFEKKLQKVYPNAETDMQIRDGDLYIGFWVSYRPKVLGGWRLFCKADEPIHETSNDVIQKVKDKFNQLCNEVLIENNLQPLDGK